MAGGFVDKLQTIAVTATLTSVAWIVGGSLYLADREPLAQKKSADVAARQQPPAAPAAVVDRTAPGARLTVPVAGVAAAQLRPSFSDLRGGGERVHEALDIMAPAGAPVLAAAPGTVERLFRSREGGNTVYVRSADRRTIHYYAHLQDYAPGLAEGQQVTRGQRLGTVGSSGNADPAAPHLHFAILSTTPDAEWWEPATAVDPYPQLREPSGP